MYMLKIFMCLLFFTGWLLRYLPGYWLERNTSYLFYMQRKPWTCVIISGMQFFFFFLLIFLLSMFLISCFILFPNYFSYCMKFHTFLSCNILGLWALQIQVWVNFTPWRGSGWEFFKRWEFFSTFVAILILLFPLNIYYTCF